MNRVYFSAYQNRLGDESIADEPARASGLTDILMREHRLYQVDFLLRKYGFSGSEIVYGENGNLSLDTDPKEAWALSHPEKFPINPNFASKPDLLRVPGLGPITVARILKRRNTGRLRDIEDVGKVGVRLKKAEQFLTF